MRKWIDIASEDVLEEKLGKLGALAAAAAMLGGSHLPKESPPAPIEAPVNAEEQEAVRLLALTMWGEARGDGPQSMRAVGHVIMNRVKSPRFGDTVKDVVWKRKAFSCWNENDPNRASMSNLSSMPSQSLDRVRWKQAVDIAKQIMAGKSQDPTNGAMFYHTDAIKPYWVSDDMEPSAKIDDHIFYVTDKA